MQNRPLHPFQRRLLRLAQRQGLENKGYREIGRLVEVAHPQLVIHHLGQLQQRGFLDKKNRLIKSVHLDSKNEKGPDLLAIPVLGTADCGPATFYAEDNVQGYLHLSENFVRRLRSGKDIFAIRAAGDSMNKAVINGESIEDGDYVLVQQKKSGNYMSGEYIVSVMNGLANIKKLRIHQRGYLMLLSESNKRFDPIIVESDENYAICGRVVAVIKQ